MTDTVDILIEDLAMAKQEGMSTMSYLFLTISTGNEHSFEQVLVEFFGVRLECYDKRNVRQSFSTNLQLDSSHHKIRFSVSLVKGRFNMTQAGLFVELRDKCLFEAVVGTNGIRAFLCLHLPSLFIGISILGQELCTDRDNSNCGFGYFWIAASKWVWVKILGSTGSNDSSLEVQDNSANQTGSRKAIKSRFNAGADMRRTPGPAQNTESISDTMEASNGSTEDTEEWYQYEVIKHGASSVQYDRGRYGECGFKGISLRNSMQNQPVNPRYSNKPQNHGKVRDSFQLQNLQSKPNNSPLRVGDRGYPMQMATVVVGRCPSLSHQFMMNQLSNCPPVAVDRRDHLPVGNASSDRSHQSSYEREHYSFLGDKQGQMMDRRRDFQGSKTNYASGCGSISNFGKEQVFPRCYILLDTGDNVNNGPKSGEHQNPFAQPINYAATDANRSNFVHHSPFTEPDHVALVAGDRSVLGEIKNALRGRDPLPTYEGSNEQGNTVQGQKDDMLRGQINIMLKQRDHSISGNRDPPRDNMSYMPRSVDRRNFEHHNASTLPNHGSLIAGDRRGTVPMNSMKVGEDFFLKYQGTFNLKIFVYFQKSSVQEQGGNMPTEQRELRGSTINSADVNVETRNRGGPVPMSNDPTHYTLVRESTSHEQQRHLGGVSYKPMSGDKRNRTDVDNASKGKCLLWKHQGSERQGYYSPYVGSTLQEQRDMRPKHRDHGSGSTYAPLRDRKKDPSLKSNASGSSDPITQRNYTYANYVSSGGSFPEDKRGENNSYSWIRDDLGVPEVDENVFLSKWIVQGQNKKESQCGPNSEVTN